MSGQSLASLEQLALMAVATLGRAHAPAVRKEILANTTRTISRGAVYVTLDRLQKKGYLRSEMGQPTAQRGGKAKRIFVVEPAGRAALRESLTELRNMARRLDDLVVPESL